MTVWPSDSTAYELWVEGAKDNQGKPTTPENPQLLNRYSYVQNNPIIHVDPTGHCSFKSHVSGSCLNKAKAILLNPNASATDKALAIAYANAVYGLGAVLALGGYAAGAAALPASVVANTVSKAATTASVLDKLQRYLLDPDHPVGKHKAAFFEKALGYTRENMSALAKQIVFNPNTARPTEITQYGTKYNQVITIVGANGKKIDMIFAWIRNLDGVVRLVSAVPKD